MKKYFLPALMMFASIVILQTFVNAQSLSDLGIKSIVEVNPPTQVEQAHQDFINSNEWLPFLGTGYYTWLGVFWKIVTVGAGSGGFQGTAYYAIYAIRGSNLLAAVIITADGERAFFACGSCLALPTWVIPLVKNDKN